jgi:predicted DNA-binding transcriptional regulator YafY
VAGPRRTGVHSLPRRLPTEDAAAFVRAGIENLPARVEVTVRIDAPAAVVRSRIGPWGSLEELDHDRCLLRMTADSLDWPSLALGNAAAEFEVVSPPALVDHLAEQADRFGRAVRRSRPS